MYLNIPEAIEFLKLTVRDPLEVIAILQEHHPDVSLEILTQLVTEMFKSEGDVPNSVENAETGVAG